MRFSKNLFVHNLILFKYMVTFCIYHTIHDMIHLWPIGNWSYWPTNSFKTHGNYSPNSKETRCEKIMSGTFCLVIAPEFQSLFHLMVYRSISHSPCLLPSFFRREEKRITKDVILSHAFLLDQPRPDFWEILNLTSTEIILVHPQWEMIVWCIFKMLIKNVSSFISH